MIVSWIVHQKLNFWRVVFIYWYINAFVIWWTNKYGENNPKLLSLKVFYKFWDDGGMSKNNYPNFILIWKISKYIGCIFLSVHIVSMNICLV